MERRRASKRSWYMHFPIRKVGRPSGWLRPRRLLIAALVVVVAVGLGSYGLLVLSTVNSPPAASLPMNDVRPTSPPSSAVACANAPRPTVPGGRSFEGPWVIPSGAGGLVG